MKKPCMIKIPNLQHPFPVTELNTAQCQAMELKWPKLAYQCSAEATETITLPDGSFQAVCEYHYEEWIKYYQGVENEDERRF